MFNHIVKQLFLTLISKRKHLRKFQDGHEKPGFRFLSEKYHLWKYLELIYQNCEYIYSGTYIVKDIQMQYCFLS